jgi:hypothetical protein
MHSIRYTTQILRLTPQNDITTQSPTGKACPEPSRRDKGRGDWFDRFRSTPIPAFPYQGEKSPNAMQRYASIFISVGERKVVNHFG